jgi:hypothetical protein
VRRRVVACVVRGGGLRPVGSLGGGGGGGRTTCG